MLQDKLDAAFTRFEQMQNAHFKWVEDGKTPDFKKLVFERNHAFEELKNVLHECFRWIRNSKDKKAPKIAADWRKRLQADLQQEQQLSRKMASYRVFLSDMLKNMHQGKKALTGYGHACSSASPKYVSKKG